MTFTENWFGDASCERLAEMGRSVVDVPGVIIENGSWEGRSSIALAQAVAPRVVHCVDTWLGSPNEVSAELAAQRDVYATFLANTAGLNIEPHRMGWREYAQGWDQPIALLFIDAEHTRKEVSDCIQAFRPYLSPGGVIAGDDQHFPPIRQALLDNFDPRQVDLQATVWSWRNL